MSIDDLKRVIRDHERSRPRSVQRAIGPSEVGTRCGRRLAYRMLDVDPVNHDPDPWAAIVGTATHAWLEAAFAEENARLGWDRWETEVRVDLPTYMSGSVDLYDHHTRTVIDHKVRGAAAMKRAKAGVSEQERTQVHIYACGLRMQGYDVEHVAIVSWPRAGTLRDAIYWTEPYDEAVVEAALERIDAMRVVLAAGTAALPMIPTADAFCSYCPFYLPASTDAATACPGHAEAPTAAPAA